jgi:hypothetical protein
MVLVEQNAVKEMVVLGRVFPGVVHLEFILCWKSVLEPQELMVC